jgi:hypothetical protein
METKPPSDSCHNDLLSGYRSSKKTSAINNKIKDVFLNKMPKEGVIFGHLVQAVEDSSLPFKYKIKKRKKKEEEVEEEENG